MAPRLRKTSYRLAEAAALLGVEPYVLRYWQTRFPMLALRRDAAGQARFGEAEMRILLRIHEMLHGEKYTLGQAIERLAQELEANGGTLPDPEAAPRGNPERLLPAGEVESCEEHEECAPEAEAPGELVEEIARLKAELEELRRALG